MFSALTRPNYPKAALGLEREFVTALALQKEGRSGFGIKQAATIELPEGLLNPSFIEHNIANPQEMLALIEEVCVKAGLGGQKRWSVSLPGNSARTAILTLDTEPASKAELDEVLDWKAESSFGAPAGELRLSMQKISPDRDGKARYFSTAVKLSVIDEYENLFETFGWQCGLILPRAVGRDLLHR
jgi:Tfp pilus assembly PilM family ATPase